ncbi:MAG: hypothetical protein ACEY3J_03340 [Arsenophonus sp.]
MRPLLQTYQLIPIKIDCQIDEGYGINEVCANHLLGVHYISSRSV